MSEKDGSSSIGWVLAVVAFVAFLMFLGSEEEDQKAVIQTASRLLGDASSQLDEVSGGSAPAQAKPSTSLVAQDWPPHGAGPADLVKRNTAGSGCLNVSAPKGKYAYLVKLKDASGADAFAAFLHPGKSFRFSVHPGDYSLTYGTGEKWYGWDGTFGPEGAYAVNSEAKSFGCWDLTLQKMQGGNMRTSALGYEDF